jgi:hypothetical protein
MSSNLTTSAVSSFIDSLIEVSEARMITKRRREFRGIIDRQAFLWRRKTKKKKEQE